MAELRWNCEKQGCRVEVAHPMMHDFDGPFQTNPPRNIQCMDIDCTVEVDGYFLFVEFKSHADMEDGQRRYYERLTTLKGVCGSDTVTVLYVVGDANRRVCEAVRTCANGEWSEWDYSLDWAGLINKVQTFKDACRSRFIARREAKLLARLS